MNETEIFAEKHFGRKAKLLRNIIGIDSSVYSNTFIIGGMYANSLIYLNLKSIGTNKSHAFRIDEIELCESLPDDCDECGAVGEQPCNYGCPNKENI